MKDESDVKTTAPEAKKFLPFPEAQIPAPEGQHASAFSQHDPNTGWLWIGIKLEDVTFRKAWSFVLNHHDLLDRLYSAIEQKRMLAARIAPPNGGKGGLKGLLKGLRG